MREPGIVILDKVVNLDGAQQKALQFINAITPFTKILCLNCRRGDYAEKIKISELSKVKDQVNHWLSVEEDMTIGFYQEIDVPEDSDLTRFGAMSFITWNSSSKTLQFSFSLDTHSLFRVSDVGLKDAIKRSQWLRAVADELFKEIKPEKLFAGFEVSEDLTPDPDLPPTLPWIVYARSVDVFNQIFLEATGEVKLDLSQDKLHQILDGNVYNIEYEEDGAIRICFYETIDGATSRIDPIRLLKDGRKING